MGLAAARWAVGTHHQLQHHRLVSQQQQQQPRVTLRHCSAAAASSCEENARFPTGVHGPMWAHWAGPKPKAEGRTTCME